MKPVVVYTGPACGYCMRAKELLKRHNIPFQEIPLSWDDEAAWKEAIRRSGMRTVPQIFIGDECIGGYTELAALELSGKLAEKLK